MKKLILVNGDVATGKSHYAEILKQKFNIPLYTKDEYKEYMADKTNCCTKDDSHKLSILAMDHLCDIFIENATKGTDLILEANFHEDYLSKIENIAKTYDYKILCIDLVAKTKIIYERYINRIRFENRHKVHTLNSLLDYEKFKSYVESRKFEKTLQNTIIVNADNFEYQKDQTLFSQIEAFLKK